MSSPIKHRCPRCKKKRSDQAREAPGNHGGEKHPRRKPWVIIDEKTRICGWCAERSKETKTDP